MRRALRFLLEVSEITAHTEAPAAIRRAYRLRTALFLLGSLLLVFLLAAVYFSLQGLSAIKDAERERDHWQRAAEVLSALGVHEGNAVADIGCGVGYFTLKLSLLVGDSGKVLAVDIIDPPLRVLRVRALWEDRHNIRTIHGRADDPLLAGDSLDAVLIANTYHEFGAPKAMLEHIRAALKPGGSLVILDRATKSGQKQTRPVQQLHHELRPDLADADLREAGFELVNRQDGFIERPGYDDAWWLLIAVNPKQP